ncbi:MAG: HAMP domain-containing histidine kinase [Bifidobacteriaceae bacterium]|nr:HAMP domain-containing histidine kinase [Bifidobacteriaceae bacterium]
MTQSAQSPPRRAGRRGPARWLRRSLQARTLLTTLLLGGATISLLAAFLTVQIRNGLFDERVGDALAEASRGAQEAQSNFDTAETDSVLTVGARAQGYVGRLHQTGSSARAVFLALSPKTNSGAQAISQIATDGSLWDVLSDSLLNQASATGGQVWQPVGIPDGGGESPGIAVASPVSVLSNQYILVFVYDLSAEAWTLRLIGRILAAGGGAIVLILVGVTWLAVHQAVRPVRAAAAVAKLLTDGDLSRRMEAKGEDELATLATAFNEMAASLQNQIEQLERLSLLQRRFVSDVSHELRTPLTTIRMAGQMIHDARSDFPPALARSAELLYNQIERFDALLADLLEISRFDARAASLEAEHRDLRQLVGVVADDLEPLAERKGVAVRRFFSADPAVADIDPRRIARIVRNLVANAIEHSDGKPVDVHVAHSATAVAVVVRDHGVGMSAEEVAHAFDRFWRADPARARTTGGTGLGLAIAQEDALLHAGALEAWGELGLGASFRLTLPRAVGAPIGEAPLGIVPDAEEFAAADGPAVRADAAAGGWAGPGGADAAAGGWAGSGGADAAAGEATA